MIEFTPSTTPPPLRTVAMLALARGARPPPDDAQYIYALVFPRYKSAPPPGAIPRAQAAQAEMRGLLTALATASRRGVINVALRSGHMMYDPADRSFRLTDWDYAVAVSEASGRDAEFPRDDAASCVTHVPAVPMHIWGELSPKKTTVAPELLFTWLDGGRAGCRFTPAHDIWHAGLRLAELLGCLSPRRATRLLEPSALSVALGRRGAPKLSVVSTFADIYGTRALYALLDAHGWRLDRSCAQICTPLPGPLKFTLAAINDCVRQCEARVSVDRALASRTAQIAPRGLTSRCHVDAASSARVGRHVDADGYDLLARMIALDPKRRINATAALSHPYLARQGAAARQGSSAPCPAPRLPASRVRQHLPH